MLAGVDLGGTQVRVAVAEDSGRVVGSARTRTGLVGGPAGMAAWAAREARRLAGGGRLARAAIGAPGPIDAGRGVLVNPPNLPGWENAPLGRLLADAMGCPVHVENDANLAGLGEYHQGAGRGSGSMVYITWSTGVGGGLILDGELYSGAHGAAGELGHMVVNPDGPVDACGQRGCLEVYCGGRQLQKRTGESAVEIFEEADRGDSEALAIIQEAARHMGVGLVNIANLFDPDLIVIGGGVSRRWKTVRPTLLQVLRSSPFIRPARRPQLRRARLGDRGGQVGAVEWARIQASRA